MVLASAGYPGTPRTGDAIHGIEEAEALGATVFHAGTRAGAAAIETAGGRVLGVTASGSGLADAIENAYRAAGKIHFEGMHYRRDIGRKGPETLGRVRIEARGDVAQMDRAAAS